MVHLSWNEGGSELAIADSAGRVSVFAISMAMNSFGGSRSAMMDADDDGNQVVGLLWLNMNRPVRSDPSGICFDIPVRSISRLGAWISAGD